MEKPTVLYSTAILAKEKGFDLKSRWIYTKDGRLIDYLEYAEEEVDFETNTSMDEANNEKWEGYEGCTAPTQTELQQWLMLEGRHYFVRLGRTRLGWYYDIINSWTGNMIKEFTLEQMTLHTAREALEEGLYEALELVE